MVLAIGLALAGCSSSNWLWPSAQATATRYLQLRASGQLEVAAQMTAPEARASLRLASIPQSITIEQVSKPADGAWARPLGPTSWSRYSELASVVVRARGSATGENLWLVVLGRTNKSEPWEVLIVNPFAAMHTLVG